MLLQDPEPARRLRRLDQLPRRLASLVVVATACALIGAWAPAAWADPIPATGGSDGAPGTSSTNPPSGGAPAVDPPSSGGTPPASPPSAGPDQPPASTSPSPPDSPPADNTPTSSPPTGDASPSDSTPRSTSSSGDGGGGSTGADSQKAGGGQGGGTNSSPATTGQGTTTPPNQPGVSAHDLAAFAPDYIDGPFDVSNGGSTGGFAPSVAGSSWSCVLCVGRASAAGLLRRAASTNPAQERPPPQNSASKASALSIFGLPGAAGPLLGQFFNFFGGGPGAVFLLFGLVAVLTGTQMRIPDWTRAFRLLTASSPLSAYVPPIESPG